MCVLKDFIQRRKINDMLIFTHEGVAVCLPSSRSVAYGGKLLGKEGVGPPSSLVMPPLVSYLGLRSISCVVHLAPPCAHCPAVSVPFTQPSFWLSPVSLCPVHVNTQTPSTTHFTQDPSLSWMLLPDNAQWRHNYVLGVPS